MPNDYSRKSLNNFVQSQGGNLANLGATPSYTGAPAMRGTPPGPNAAAYQNAPQQAAFQRPPQQQGMPQAGMQPQGSLQNLGQRPGFPPRPGMPQAGMPQQMPQQSRGRPPLTPQQQQRLMLMQRQRPAMNRPQGGGRLQNLGQPPQMGMNPVRPR